MTNDSPGPTIQSAYDGASLDEPSGQGAAKKHDGRPASITFIARLRRGWRGTPRSAEQLPIGGEGQLWSILGAALVFGTALYLLWRFLDGAI